VILELHSDLKSSEVGFDWGPLLDSTEGYSGSDLAMLAQCALLQPVRELQHAEFWVYREGTINHIFQSYDIFGINLYVSYISDGMIVPCDSEHPRAMACSVKDLPPNLVNIFLYYIQ
jgi:hypothetical protein